MAVRFLEEGYQYLDPVSGANPMGSVVVYDDGESTAPWNDRPGYGQNDLIANEAMRWMEVPREQILATRPPVPQQVFPPRFGYVHDPATIGEILDISMWTPQRRSWVAPQVRTLQRVAPDDQMWDGSVRNASGNMNPMG